MDREICIQLGNEGYTTFTEVEDQEFCQVCGAKLTSHETVDGNGAQCRCDSYRRWLSQLHPQLRKARKRGYSGSSLSLLDPRLAEGIAHDTQIGRLWRTTPV